MLLTKVIALDAALSITDMVIPQGQEIRSIYYANIPVGVTVSHAFNQKFPVPVYDGQSWDFNCDPQTGGFSLVTTGAFAGQSIIVQFGMGAGGGTVGTGV